MDKLIFYFCFSVERKAVTQAFLCRNASIGEVYTLSNKETQNDVTILRALEKYEILKEKGEIEETLPDKKFKNSKTLIL